MSILSATHVSANTARHDDRQCEMAYLGLIDAFGLDPSTWGDAAEPPPAVAAGDEPPDDLYEADEEDRAVRESGQRLHLDEDAWWQGYTLGYAGISADAPTGMSGHLRRAFTAGLEAGWVALEHDDRLAWSDRFNEESLRLLMEDDDAQSRYEEAELASANISRKAV